MMAIWDGPQDKKPQDRDGYSHGGGANDSCLIALVLLPITLPVALVRRAVRR